jgi:hypothetical protein
MGMIKNYLKDKINPYFPFFTDSRMGIDLEIYTLSGEYLVYYKTEDGKKDNVKFNYTEGKSPKNLFKESSNAVKEKEGDKEFERVKIIQISS